jgi:predicted PurR-regulated permease PerM
MIKSEAAKYPRIIFTAFVIALAALSFLLVKPFLISIFLAFICSYIFYPVYKLILRKVKNRNVSAFIVTALLFVLLTVPFVLFLNKFITELSNSYSAVQGFLEQSYRGVGCSSDTGVACRIYSSFSSAMQKQPFGQGFIQMFSEVTAFFTKSASAFVFSLPGKAFQLFVVFFTFFFLLRDNELISGGIWRLFMIKESHKKVIISKFNDTLYAVIYGNVIVAIVQGVFAAVGFSLLGVNSAILWGFLTTVAALIPFIGPPSVWFPLGAIQIISGYGAQDIAAVRSGVFILLYGFFIISTIDNILKPKIISDRAKIGTVGGIAFFGLTGIILGPVILALFFACIEIYRTEYLEQKKVTN